MNAQEIRSIIEFPAGDELGNDLHTEDTKLKKPSGFTLIELLIVILVVAILAAVALPSYQEHVRKTRRAQAKTDMLEIAQVLEREFTLNRSYLGFNEGANDRSPRTGTVYYDITYVPAITASTYTIVATPTAAVNSDAKCGTLSLDNKGTKTASGPLGVAGCW